MFKLFIFTSATRQSSSSVIVQWLFLRLLVACVGGWSYILQFKRDCGQCLCFNIYFVWWATKCFFWSNFSSFIFRSKREIVCREKIKLFTRLARFIIAAAAHLRHGFVAATTKIRVRALLANLFLIRRRRPQKPRIFSVFSSSRLFMRKLKLWLLNLCASPLILVIKC